MKGATREEWKHRLIFGFGGALAIVLAVFGVLSTNTDPPEDGAISGFVQQRFPERAAVVELQQEVGIQLDPTFQLDAQIYVDGVPIPADEYTAGDKNLGQFVFKPGPGKAVREWTQGRHEVQVDYWPREAGIEVGPVSSEVWFFTAA